MAIAGQALLDTPFAPTLAIFGADDVILYNLAIGAGQEGSGLVPLDQVMGARPLVLPTMANVLGYSGFWADDPRCAIDAAQAVHVGQDCVFHRPLPSCGTVRRQARIIGVEDRGAGRGAVVAVQEELSDAGNGERLATLTSLVLCRGDGGCGSAGSLPSFRAAMPERIADERLRVATQPQQAMLYQLCGDRNPLHLDAAVARSAGFERPIMQGLASLGIVSRPLMAAFCVGDPSRIRRISVRFAGAVYPGETLEIEAWRYAPGEVRFEVNVADRDALALSEGRMLFDECPRSEIRPVGGTGRRAR